MKAESRQIPQKLAARLKFVCYYSSKCDRFRFSANVWYAGYSSFNYKHAWTI